MLPKKELKAFKEYLKSYNKNYEDYTILFQILLPIDWFIEDNRSNPYKIIVIINKNNLEEKDILIFYKYRGKIRIDNDIKYCINCLEYYEDILNQIVNWIKESKDKINIFKILKRG